MHAKREEYRNKSEPFYSFQLASMEFIDSKRFGNKSRFINHSNTCPNLETKIIFANGDYHIILTPIRPIPSGHELLFDYNPNGGLSHYKWLNDDHNYILNTAQRNPVVQAIEYSTKETQFQRNMGNNNNIYIYIIL